VYVYIHTYTYNPKIRFLNLVLLPKLLIGHTKTFGLRISALKIRVIL